MKPARVLLSLLAFLALLLPLRATAGMADRVAATFALIANDFVAARFIVAEDAPSPRAGDGARITRARIRVAVTPTLDMTGTRADLRRVPFMIAAALEGSKRFLAVDPLAVSDMFASGSVRVEEVLARPERVVRVARNLEVAGWVVSMVMERRGVTYLDVTYISAITGNALFSRRLPLVAPNATEDQRFPWEPRPED